MTHPVLDLVIHPVRLRILQMLTLRPLTTQAIGEALPDVPTSSLYRHIKQLLDGGLITVLETNQVRGIEERVYTLAQSPSMAGPEDFLSLPPDEHVRYFTLFATALIQGFTNYVFARDGEHDLMADRVGYTDMLFYASTEQMDALGNAINSQLRPLVEQGPGEGRTLRKISVITHPVPVPPVEDDA
ncbi:MAG: helix-turn-helix domain-containing protein [Anaerolineae bacterium]|nr:helix-turn-helix domain-containing protein [Anaerolineae bacterium]